MPASTRRALYLGKTGSSVKHEGFGVEPVRPRTSDCCHGALDGWMCLWLVCTWLLVKWKFVEKEDNLVALAYLQYSILLFLAR